MGILIVSEELGLNRSGTNYSRLHLSDDQIRALGAGEATRYWYENGLPINYSLFGRSAVSGSGLTSKPVVADTEQGPETSPAPTPPEAGTGTSITERRLHLVGVGVAKPEESQQTEVVGVVAEELQQKTNAA